LAGLYRLVTESVRWASYQQLDVTVGRLRRRNDVSNGTLHVTESACHWKYRQKDNE